MKLYTLRKPQNRLAFFLTLFAINHINADCHLSNTTWLPRSTASNATVEIFLEKGLFSENVASKPWNGILSFATTYAQNFGKQCNNAHNLGAMPFWSGTNTLTVGNNDGKADLDAYQLGLGNVITDENGIAGTITLNPQVQQASSTLLLYYVQDKNDPGFFFKLGTTLGAMVMTNHVKEQSVVPDNTLNFTQTTNPGDQDIEYQWFNYPPPYRRYQSIENAFFGGLNQCNIIGGNLQKPVRLRKGRIDPNANSKIRLGDLWASAGYNFIARDSGLLAAAFKASCPTGNVPTCDYLLEPIFGRAGAWAVGGEIISFYKITPDHSNYTLNIWFQGELLHLFSGRRPNYRSFDLKQNGPGSKYLLVQEYLAYYNKSSASPFDTVQDFAPNTLHPAINFTTLPVISSIGLEGNCALVFDFSHNNFNVSLGAEFWGRTHEKLELDRAYILDLRLETLNNYAVLGRQVSSYAIDGQATAVTSFYCEPLAKINQSQDPVILSGTTPNVTTPTTLPDGIADARDPKNRIPEKLTDALDICGAQAPACWTGKATLQAGYTWNNHCYTPSLSLFGNVEFVSDKKTNTPTWGAGLQGNINF